MRVELRVGERVGHCFIDYAGVRVSSALVRVDYLAHPEGVVEHKEAAFSH